MENPSCWKRAEKVISDAHKEWRKGRDRGAYGLSLPGTIAARLREAGIISDADEPEIGWDGLAEPAEVARRRP